MPRGLPQPCQKEANPSSAAGYLGPPASKEDQAEEHRLCNLYFEQLENQLRGACFGVRKWLVFGSC